MPMSMIQNFKTQNNVAAVGNKLANFWNLLSKILKNYEPIRTWTEAFSKDQSTKVVWVYPLTPSTKQELKSVVEDGGWSEKNW